MVFKVDQSKQIYTTLWAVRHLMSEQRVGCVVEYFLFKGTLCRRGHWRAALSVHKKHKELIIKIRCFLFWLTIRQQSFNVRQENLENSNLNSIPELFHASSAVRRRRTWSSGLQNQLKSDSRRVSQWKKSLVLQSTNINKSTTHKVILNKTRSQQNLGQVPYTCWDNNKAYR